jgi:multidrug efflux system outer membrane protein
MKKRLDCFGTASFFFTGCAVGPKYRKPESNRQMSFEVMPTPPAQRSSSLADLSGSRFSKISVCRVIRTALDANYDLREALARVDGAAPFLVSDGPTVSNLEVLAEPRRFATPRRPFALRALSEANIGGIALNLLSFEIDLWGRLRHATAARANLFAIEETVQGCCHLSRQRSGWCYFNLLELDMELEIAKRTLTAREDSLSSLESGTRTVLEVSKASSWYTAA